MFKKLQCRYFYWDSNCLMSRVFSSQAAELYYKIIFLKIKLKYFLLCYIRVPVFSNHFPNHINLVDIKPLSMPGFKPTSFWTCQHDIDWASDIFLKKMKHFILLEVAKFVLWSKVIWWHQDNWFRLQRKSFRYFRIDRKWLSWTKSVYTIICTSKQKKNPNHWHTRVQNTGKGGDSREYFFLQKIIVGCTLCCKKKTFLV